MSEYFHVISWFILIEILGLVSIPFAGKIGNRLSGNFTRMNTVFKFYMHLWFFLAIAASYSYYDLTLRFKARYVDCYSSGSINNPRSRSKKISS